MTSTNYLKSEKKVKDVKGFHVENGLFFSKDEKGNVVIEIYETSHVESTLIKDFIIDKETWASIISTVSKENETSKKWKDALEFHGFD